MQAISRMRRYLQEQLLVDLSRKAVVLTGARQVGKTTLARQVMEGRDSPQYLNWDVAADRSVLLRQSWNPRADLLVFDEIHKMADWKAWLKGVIDSRPSRTLPGGTARRHPTLAAPVRHRPDPRGRSGIFPPPRDQHNGRVRRVAAPTGGIAPVPGTAISLARCCRP